MGNWAAGDGVRFFTEGGLPSGELRQAADTAGAIYEPVESIIAKSGT
jgi:hypothetical protein